MITNYYKGETGHLVKENPSQMFREEGLVWVDILNPSREERRAFELNNNVTLPYLHETIQIEYSNRFYAEEGVYFLSVNVLIKVVPYPENQVVTLILMKDKIVTLRYGDAKPIDAFIRKLHASPIEDMFDVLVLLLQEFIGAVANVFEMLGTSTDMLALGLMQTVEDKKHRDHTSILTQTLKEISKYENVLSKSYQSLSSLTLVVNYFERTGNPYFTQKISRFELMTRDIVGLSKHADYLTQKLEFQLESTLGLLNIEQTHIIKVFTVLAMIFMPPTLIASIYGMNFKFMPELQTTYGYPFAIGLMIISSLLPYRFFKRRGWI